MSLLRTAKTGMAWTTFSMIIRSLVSLLQIAILTRFLDKTEFGLIAIATLFIGFTQLFLDLGLSSGIIHKQNITSKQYSSMFWLNVFTGLILTIFLCVLSPIIANAYRDISLIKILILLSLTVFFASLGSQHKTVQQKEMRFKYIALIEVSCSILTFAFAVFLAVYQYGIYSLVYSTLFNALVSNLLFLTIGLYNDKNIHFHFNLCDTYPFLKIGVFSVGSQILDYLSREMDVIFISATFGKEVLGIYSLCKKLVFALYGSINPVITKVLTPLLAKMQTDKSKMQTVFYSIIQTLSLTNFPIYFLLSIFSNGILNFIYGEQYKGGAIILSILSVYYGYLSTGNPVGSLQVALGRTDSGFYWTILRILLSFIAVYIGSYFSIEVLVLCLFVVYLLSTPLAWRITIRPLIGGKLLEFYLLSFSPFLISFCLAIPLYFFLYDTSSIYLILFFSLLYLLITVIIFRVIFPKSYIISLLNSKITQTLIHFKSKYI
jgi:O-antigen/teichoic acid export membrane protein